MPCTIFFISCIHLHVSIHLSSPHLSPLLSPSVINPCCVVFAPCINQTGHAEPQWHVSRGEGARGYCACVLSVYGGSSLLLLIKRHACEIQKQTEMKAHQCQFWVRKHLLLSVWRRWKYLVHDMGVSEHCITEKGCTVPTFMENERTFVLIKRQINKHATPQLVGYVRQHFCSVHSPHFISSLYAHTKHLFTSDCNTALEIGNIQMPPSAPQCYSNIYKVLSPT